MKKIAIFFMIVIAILGSFWYIISQRKNTLHAIELNNMGYERFLYEETTANDLATLINKTVNQNEKNGVEKDSEGLYIDNHENSVTIQIKFLENDNIINSEKMYEIGFNKFMNLYRTHKFMCRNIEYHHRTKLVKYLYFEEI